MVEEQDKLELQMVLLEVLEGEVLIALRVVLEQLTKDLLGEQELLVVVSLVEVVEELLKQVTQTLKVTEEMV